MKEIVKIFLNLRKNHKNLLVRFSKLKDYYDYHDVEYGGIRDVKNSFELSIDENYYPPIIINDAFNSNYIEYESREDKDKTLSIKEYLNMIKPYLRNTINYQ